MPVIIDVLSYRFAVGEWLSCRQRCGRFAAEDTDAHRTFSVVRVNYR